MPILHVAMCVTLMWGAVEKWAYPQWTFPLLAERPYLTFGLVPQDFMIVAGFVEFALAFYILTGSALVRLAVGVLMSIFVAAIADFGKLDAVGHLPMLVSLLAMLLHGPSPVHRWLHGMSDGAVMGARKASVAFATSVFLFLSVYYGLQNAEYGPATHHSPLAAFAAPSHGH
jgi:hypothetical protein